jgi:hypothetical protein
MENNPFIPAFQRRLLAILLQKPDTYTRFDGMWDTAYFDDPMHSKIVHAYMRIRVLGSEQPTKVSIKQELLKGYTTANEYPTDVNEMLAELEVLYTFPTENVNYSLNEVREWAPVFCVPNPSELCSLRPNRIKRGIS